MTKPRENTLPTISWLTVVEVAEFLRVSKMTVYRWIKAGELPAIKVGRSFRVDEKHVQAVHRGELVIGETPQWSRITDARRAQ